MDIVLDWSGPYHFSSPAGPPIFEAPAAQGPGVYLWLAATSRGLLPHYVGETGRSVARRHYEHFRDYASGVYSVRDSAAFVAGREVFLYKGPLWRNDGWRAAQQVIDRFAEFAGHLSVSLAALRLFVAPLDAEQRVRRRVESGLIKALYALPEASRSLFPPGFRTLSRSGDEPITVRHAGTHLLDGLPECFQA